MDIAEAIDMIEEIFESGPSRLSDWENNFLESIQNSTFPDLTEKQTACLKKIYNRIIG